MTWWKSNHCSCSELHHHAPDVPGHVPAGALVPSGSPLIPLLNEVRITANYFLRVSPCSGLSLGRRMASMLVAQRHLRFRDTCGWQALTALLLFCFLGLKQLVGIYKMSCYIIVPQNLQIVCTIYAIFENCKITTANTHLHASNGSVLSL